MNTVPGTTSTTQTYTPTTAEAIKNTNEELLKGFLQGLLNILANHGDKEQKDSDGNQINEEAVNAAKPDASGEVSNIFNELGNSIYGLAAAILLLSMESKQQIIRDRLDEIQSANDKVQELSSAISDLKAVTGGKEGGDKVDVDLKHIQLFVDNFTDEKGKPDPVGGRKWLEDNFGLEYGSILNDNGETSLKAGQVEAMVTKLQAMSEAISTQNQTRNIKLQQQTAELQLVTQMCSGFIDQFKQVGGFINQKI